MTVLPLARVRDQLSALVDEVARTHDTLTITRNGVPTAVVLAADDYESILETFALLSDPTDRARLDEAERSIAGGDVTPSDQMRALLADRIHAHGPARGV